MVEFHFAYDASTSIVTSGTQLSSALSPPVLFSQQRHQTSSFDFWKALTPGRTAAAVIMPLLVIACIIAGYICWTRLKSKEQRKRFSIAVDKRMSSISADWKSMSNVGAAAAIRSSVAVRNTQFHRPFIWCYSSYHRYR
jgi:hypothetical protein